MGHRCSRLLWRVLLVVLGGIRLAPRSIFCVVVVVINEYGYCVGNMVMLSEEKSWSECVDGGVG